MEGAIVLVDWTPGASGCELGVDLMDLGAVACSGMRQVPLGPHLLRMGSPLSPQLVWVWLAAEAPVARVVWDPHAESARVVDNLGADFPVPISWPAYAQHDDQWAERAVSCVKHASVVQGPRPLVPTRRQADCSALLPLLGTPLASVIGHLQRAFVEFSLGHDADAFEVWAGLAVLLCHCPEAVRSQPALFEAFAVALAWQLEQAGAEMLVAGVGSKNRVNKLTQGYLSLSVFAFLSPLSISLFGSVHSFVNDVLLDMDLPPPLQASARTLALAAGVDATDDDPDDAPVVVHM